MNEALKAALRVVCSRKPATTVLGHFAIAGGVIRATNLDMTLTAPAASDAEPGLYDIGVFCRAGNLAAAMSDLPPETFPETPTGAEGAEVVVDAGMFTDLDTPANFCVRADGKRPRDIVCISGNEVVATDGHTLYRKVVAKVKPVPEILLGSANAIRLAQLARISPMIRVSLSEGLLVAQFCDFEACFKTEAGPYIDYKKALPDTFTHTLELSSAQRARCVEALTRLSPLLQSPGHMVFMLGNNILCNGTSGKKFKAAFGDITFPTVWTGNALYALRALSVFERGVIINYSAREKMAIMTITDTAGSVSTVVMPTGANDIDTDAKKYTTVWGNR